MRPGATMLCKSMNRLLAPLPQAALAVAALIVLAFASPARADLLTSLEGHWKLEEASGTRVDAHGSNDLTDNNTVTQNPGKIGDAGQFTAANSEYLSIVDNASLSTGDIDFTIAAWIYLDSKSAEMTIAAKDAPGDREWTLRWVTGDVFRFDIWATGGGSIGRVDANSFGAPSIATWYFVMAWHDATANKVYIQVNNGTVNEVATTGVIADKAAAFTIGRRGTFNWDGRIDSVSFWKRTLTTQERTDLYGGGSGLDYPFTPPPQRSFGTILFRIPVGFPVGGLTWPIW